MRCPKCGRTSFDYADRCEKCGRDLADTRALLGDFPKPESGLNWFEVGAKGKTAQIQAAAVGVEERGSRTVDLSEIDVTDLIGDQDKAEADDYMGDIDSAALEAAVEDEKFQAALVQILGEK